MKSWFVYIAQARNGYYYVGISPDPKSRIVKHNNGKGAKMAQDNGPFELVYVSQSFKNKSIARKREIQVKGWNRDKKEKLINGEWV